jgi:hypothetical protein
MIIIRFMNKNFFLFIFVPNIYTVYGIILYITIATATIMNTLKKYISAKWLKTLI